MLNKTMHPSEVSNTTPNKPLIKAIKDCLIKNILY